MRPFSIAALQLDLKKSDNLGLVMKKTRETLLRFPWVDMVVLSELAIEGTSLANAQAMGADAEVRLSELARELGIWLVPGSLYRKQGNKIYNRALVYNPEGVMVAKYDKLYPFLPYEQGVDAGQDVTIFDVPGVGKFGLMICYDIWFPEIARALTSKGAEVLLHPNLTDTHDRDVELSIVRATAAQFQSYVINVNGAGALGNGRSQIVGPEGDVIHSCGEVEEVVALEIDLDRVTRARKRGGLCLGQPLKSYRDATHSLGSHGPVEAVDALGPLEMPKKASRP